MTRPYRLMEWTDDRVKKFWDYESQFVENYFTFQVGRSVVHVLSKYLAGKKNVLDYGCGAGFLIKHLIDKNLNIAAIDFSPKSIDVVNEKFAGVGGFTGCYSIDDLASADRTFDVITVIEVIEHLNERYLAETLENIKVFLGSDGVVILTTPNDEDLSKSLVYCPDSDTVFHRWQHIRSWSVSSLTHLLKDNGFEMIEIFAVDFSIQERELDSPFLKYINKLKRVLGITARKKLPHLVAVAKVSREKIVCAE